MSGVKVNNGVINYGGIPSQGAGLLANRPAAGVLGRLFIGTDTNAWYRDTGSAWVLISAGITGSAAAGQVAFWGTATTISGDNGLFWDNTNKRLGINTITPGVRLDIHGTGVIAQFNGTGTSNSYVDFQTAGVSQWRLGNDYNGASKLFRLIDVVNSLNTIAINSTQNVGIGTTPDNWQVNVRPSIQLGVYSSISDFNGGIFTIAANTYNNGTNWIYRTTNQVTRYEQNIGSNAHIFSYALSGTAGTSITFAEAMRLQGANMGIGYPTPATMLNVSGSIFQGSNVANSNYQMLCNQNFYTVGFSPNFSTFTSGPVTISVSSNLGTGYVFKTAATITVNLPAASGLNNQLYFVVLTGTTVTVNRAGSDVIINTVGTSVTSLTLVGYTKVLLYCDGGTTWYQLF